MLARPLSAFYAMVAVAILSVVPLTLSLLAEPSPDPISVNSTVPLTPPVEPTPAPPVNPKTDEPKPSLVLAIDGPTEIEPGRMLTLRISGITTTAAIDGPLPGVSWLMYPLTEDQRIERNGHAIHATWPGPCHVWFVASVNNPDPTQKPLTAMKLVKVGEPVVPEPDVSPRPPGPKPAPVIGESFTVLILEDRETNRDLPKSQRDALSSSGVLEYLDRKCAKVDGHPEWRKWDDNLKPENISEDEPWKARYQQAYSDSNGRRPWLYASNGKAAISIPFPADESALMAELKKLGGE